MKQWKKIVLSIVFFAMIGGMTQALAIDNMNLSPDQPPGYENLWNRITRKLGRGICDVAFGVLEIPTFMSHVQFEDGNLAGATYGVIGGVGYFLVREGVGILELLTFPFPLPSSPNDPMDPNRSQWGYGPILTPEWILSPAHNDQNFFYPQTGVVK